MTLPPMATTGSPEPTSQARAASRLHQAMGSVRRTGDKPACDDIATKVPQRLLQAAHDFGQMGHLLQRTSARTAAVARGRVCH
jgi:hypothetical protein